MPNNTKLLTTVRKTHSIVSKEVDKLKANVEREQKNLEIKNSQLNHIEQELHRLENDILVVSDHALLRYMERIMGIDLQMIKDAILTDSVKKMHLQLGDGRYPAAVENNENCVVVIKSGVVVTLYSGTDSEN